jgi:hypothetical protein
MTTLPAPIHGIAAYELITGDPGDAATGILIACHAADGAFLGRRYFPALTDPAGIPAALTAGATAATRPPAPVTPADLRTRLLDRLATRRWEIETGGFVFLDRPIMSDDRSQLAILGAFTAARADPAFATIWKCADATWLTLDHAQCLALFETAAAHKQACFARETALAAQITQAGDDRAALRALAPVVEGFW